MIRIASFNVENLLRRAKAMNGDTFAEGRPILAAHREVNELFMEPNYTPAIKQRIKDLLLDDETRFTKLTCKSLGKDRTGKTRTNNKEIESHQGDSSARTMKHVR